MAGSSVEGAATISSPAAFLSMSASSSSRYSSWYFSGSNSRGERAHELARHLLLALARFARRFGQWLFTVDREHLVGEAHRLEHERAVDRTDRDQRLLRPEHEAPDRDLPELLHHVGEEAVGLGVVLVGNEVVRLLEEDRVDVGEVDEVLDLDLAGRLRLERGDLLGLDHHVLAGLELVALHDPVVRDLFARLLRHPPQADAGAGAFFELVEADVLGPRRGDHPDRHGDEAEADRSGPNCVGHEGAPEVNSARFRAYYLRRSWPLGPRVRDARRAKPTSRSADGSSG